MNISDFLKKYKKTILTIVSIGVVLFLVIFFWGKIVLGLDYFWDNWLKDIIDTETKITFAQLGTAAGIFLSAMLLFWRAKNQAKQTENLTKRVENEADTVKNQQFLDAIKIFYEAKDSLEAKKGALFHLESLAISSPAHRQRVLDFVNSLNGWMRKPENFGILTTKSLNDWDKWRNEKQIIIPVNENDTSNEQLLSAETPKIFENIIREHSKQWESFSKQEKEKYKLDFSYFIFPQINFLKFEFPQEETIFSYAYFLGTANFWIAEFLGTADFGEAKFLGTADFNEAKFSGEADFSEADFSKKAVFSKAKFSKEADFWEAKFSKEAYFYGAEFSKEADFSEAEFSGEVYFNNAKFLGEADFSEARFSGEADFKAVEFSQEADFSEAKFSGEVYFNNAKFSGEADFSEAGFSKKADFNGAKFSKEVDFNKAEFSKEADFELAKFSQEAYFSGAKFSGEADFRSAKFSQEAYFEEAKFLGDENLKDAKFSIPPDFTDTTFKNGKPEIILTKETANAF